MVVALALTAGAAVGAQQMAVTSSSAGVAAHQSAAPASWLPQDPGDSLYRAARESLNRGQYKVAAGLLQELRKRYARSGYVGDSYYWEAFARYRVGGTADLETGLKLIEQQLQGYPQSATASDAEVLATRIRGQLARRGDAAAAEKLAVEGGIVAGSSGERHRQQERQERATEEDVRLAALHALMMMESEQAVPMLREVLQQRDPGSVELRQRAIVVLGQQQTPETEEVLLDVIRNDPDSEVRSMAVMFLAQSKSDRAFEAVADIVRTSEDQEMRQRAVMMLAQHRDERAVELVRELAQEPGADEELQQFAIVVLGQSHDPASREFLRQMYRSTNDPETKQYIIHSLSVSPRSEDRAWLFERARDPNEPADVRRAALVIIAQQKEMPTEELLKIYDSTEDSELRQFLLFSLAQRNEPAVVDRLMAVARDDPDPEMRQQAIMWLGQSKDPRVAEFLMEIINK
jgi:HEAT repeat protein